MQLIDIVTTAAVAQSFHFHLTRRQNLLLAAGNTAGEQLASVLPRIHRYKCPHATAEPPSATILTISALIA